MLLRLRLEDPAGGLRVLVRHLHPKAADGAPVRYRELVGQIGRNAAVGQERAQDRGLLDCAALRDGGHWGWAERMSPSTPSRRDRKSTRLNSSHLVISYAVFCLKKKNIQTQRIGRLIARDVGTHTRAAPTAA